MIKDSKIIGTKIAAPFGWKKFKVGELFDVKLSQSDNKINELPVGNIPLVSSGIKNSGVVGYVSSDLLGLSPFKDSIVADMFGNWTVHEGDFYAVSHGRVNILKPNFVFSSFSCLFICSVGMKHTLGLYGFDNMLSSEKIKNFEWMSAYMKVVTQDYLEQKELSNQHEIKDYLTVGKVDSMDVTDDDRQFLRDFEKLPQRKFKVGELFDVVTPVSKLNVSDVVFEDSVSSFNYVVRTNLNNGIRGKILACGRLNEGHVLTLGQDTGTIFYQEFPFFTGDKIKIIAPKIFHLTSNLGLFFVSLFRKQLSYFTWGSSSFSVSVLSNLKLELPVIGNDEVDVQSIEKYMQIQSKPLINKVADTLAPVVESCN